MKTQFIAFLLLCSITTIFAQSTNFTEGKKAFDEGEFNVAVEYFSKDIADNPKNANTYYSRGFIYYNQSAYAKALSDANMGLKCVKGKEKKLKAVLYELRALIYTQLEEREKAIADYTTAIKTDGTDPDFYVGRAKLFYDLKMYDKADADLTSVLKFDETNAAAIVGLARNCIVRKQYTEADKLFAKLHKLHPNNEAAYYYSAISAYEQQKYDEAIKRSFMAFAINNEDNTNREMFLAYAKKDYDYAIAQITHKINEDSDNYFWLFYKGVLQENKEDYANAVVSYTASIKLMSEPHEAAYSLRANCYRNLGMQELAIADYNVVLAKDSSRAYDFGYRGESKRLKGDYAAAVVDFSRAIELEPRESWFYYRRGWVNEEFLKNNNAGLRDYSKAIEVDKNTAYTYLHRGRFYKNRLSDMPKANADFETILKLDTAVSDGSNCRQYALLELRKEAEAIEWLNKILDKYPNEGNYYDATCLYSQMNKTAEAVKYMTLAFENGYKDITHLSNDDDLNAVRNMPEFKALVTKWKLLIDAENERAMSDKDTIQVLVEHSLQSKSVIIPMISNKSGTYEVDCKINNLPLRFCFDTGAFDISISQTEVEFMLKNKYLNKSEIRGSQSFTDATGKVSVGTKIILRKVQIGDFELKNVEASVVHNKNAPLLIGQSALGKYAQILIDNQNKTITLSEKIK
jgi:clan AA aspartic protease (TIGR02281 family)